MKGSSRGKDLRRAIACVVDGETEVWYLHMLKRNEPSLRGLAIKPELPQKKSVQEQFCCVKALSKAYSEVIWIVDTDTIIRETRQFAGKGPSPKEKLKECLTKLPCNVAFIANTPCLEFWFLLHMIRTTKYYDSCESVIREMEKYPVLPGYEKTRRYFTAEGNDIYSRLRSYLPTAMNHARATGRFDANQLERGYSSMHELFEILGIAQ